MIPPFLGGLPFGNGLMPPFFGGSKIPILPGSLFAGVFTPDGRPLPGSWATCPIFELNPPPFWLTTGVLNTLLCIAPPMPEGRGSDFIEPPPLDEFDPPKFPPRAIDPRRPPLPFGPAARLNVGE